MGEQRPPPGVTEVSGTFGAQEINDPGRRRIIPLRPGKQIVNCHAQSLPDRQDGRSPPKRAR